MIQPFRCPVCEGMGTVPPGFYIGGHYSSTNSARETCKSCNGTGVVWSEEEKSFTSMRALETIDDK